MSFATRRVAERPRDYVRVAGPDAEDFLQRMVSNDVSADVCEALLLTPKARVIAPLRVLRRGDDDFLLLTERGLGDTVRVIESSYEFHGGFRLRTLAQRA
jgi:folate-binding Fe-S cluster repair protein YgfZ